MENTGSGKKQKINVLAVVKSLVRIKGSLYLCIPKAIVKKCQLEAGDVVTMVIDENQFRIVLSRSNLTESPYFKESAYS